jgi:hypothetical protein
MPAGLLGHRWYVVRKTRTKAFQSPFSHRPFPLWGSTDDKQTLNGLFYVNTPELFSISSRDWKFLRDSNLLIYL